MRIKCTNGATKSIKIPEIDHAVEFSDNGIARDKKEVCEALIEKVPSIKEYKPKSRR